MLTIICFNGDEINGVASIEPLDSGNSVRYFLAGDTDEKRPYVLANAAIRRIVATETLR